MRNIDYYTGARKAGQIETVCGEWPREMIWKAVADVGGTHVLSAGSTRVATLRFGPDETNEAVGECGANVWAIRSFGDPARQATIYSQATQKKVANIVNNAWGARQLTSSEGSIFSLHINTLQTVLDVYSTDGRQLLRCRAGPVLHEYARINIHPAAQVFSELPWLVMLTWYQVVVGYRRLHYAFGIIGPLK